MWSAIAHATGNIAHAAGSAVHGAAATVGLVKGKEEEQPPFGCAIPNVEVPFGEPKKAIAINQEHFKHMMQIQEDKTWTLVPYTDPEAADGGDIRLWTRSQIGRFHFIKVTMCFRDTPPEKIISLIASPDYEARVRFSVDCTEVRVLDQYTPTCRLVVHRFYTPPPVAPREFVFLTNNCTNRDESQCIWGCTVNSPLLPEESPYVRAACLWGWHIISVGPHSLCTYVNCVNPRGWTPSFLFAWAKNQATKEFVRIRKVIYGMELDAGVREDFRSLGLTEEEVKEQIEKEKEAAAEREAQKK